MCSIKSASDGNTGLFPSEQLEDDFITNLFSQNIDCLEAPTLQAYNSYQNVIPAASTWPFANQVDHDYTARPHLEPSAMLSPAWEEPATTKGSTLNMSTYFSTFDPSAQFPTNQQQCHVIQKKVSSIQNAMGKIHQARIHLIPTANGNFKATVKRKRKRTVFRTDQVEALEEVFAKKPYVTKEDRTVLVNRLHISDKSVKVWFQNRRLKNKRGEENSISEDENFNSPNINRLDYVESKINERTNEFGYVTLDDRIMSDLVSVIDAYLTKSNTNIVKEEVKMEVTDIVMEESCDKIDSVPIYEPISPASTNDYSNEESSWECQSPVGNEYLQTLIDIESIISK